MAKSRSFCAATMGSGQSPRVLNLPSRAHNDVAKSVSPLYQLKLRHRHGQAKTQHRCEDSQVRRQWQIQKVEPSPGGWYIGAQLNEFEESFRSRDWNYRQWSEAPQGGLSGRIWDLRVTRR